MTELTLGGRSLHYVLDDFSPPWRSTETVWIQHGVGRSGAFFRHWVPGLASRFRVIRPDMRGHGGSFDPGPDYRWSVADLIEDMVGLMDALNIERVHYVGESAGGVLGFALAAGYPERVRSLTAMSSPAAIPSAHLDNLVSKTGFSSMEDALRNMSLGDWTRAQFKSGGLTSLNAAHADWVVNEWSKNHVHNLVGIMAMLPEIDLSDIFSRIVVPTLLLAPSSSPLTSIAEQQQMAAMIPDARVQAIYGQAHEIYVDRAEECINAILQLIDYSRQGRSGTAS